jgi:hypothetical protein
MGLNDITFVKGQGQGPIWQGIAEVARQVRWRNETGADTADLADALDSLAERARADLVREWHRGHERCVSEERERIRHGLLGRVGALRAEQSRRSREAADFTHRAHKAAEKEAEAMTMADAIEAAALGLSEGEG